jgi:hypothetical protein
LQGAVDSITLPITAGEHHIVNLDDLHFTLRAYVTASHFTIQP